MLIVSCEDRNTQYYEREKSDLNHSVVVENARNKSVIVVNTEKYI